MSTYQDSLPDFVKLAEAYGHVGMRVESKEELRPAMEEAFAHEGRLVFLDIVVDPHGARLPDAHCAQRLDEGHVAQQEREDLTCAG